MGALKISRIDEVLWLDDARWPISCVQLDAGLSGHDYEFLHDQQGTAKAILLGRLETRHANGAAKKPRVLLRMINKIILGSKNW